MLIAGEGRGDPWPPPLPVALSRPTWALPVEKGQRRGCVSSDPGDSGSGYTEARKEGLVEGSVPWGPISPGPERLCVPSPLRVSRAPQKQSSRAPFSHVTVFLPGKFSWPAWPQRWGWNVCRRCHVGPTL